MVTAFMDMVGILMIIPLMPFYAKSMGAGGFVVGLLVASFSIAQLLMAPVWGRLSDHYGRRPALIVGMTASAVAYVIFCWLFATLYAAAMHLGRRSPFRARGLART